MSVTHFRDLDVWRVAMELARHVYEVAATFPREERYGLTSQMQRAAVSIPSNIAEGNARQSTRDYARFIGIASGSVAELQTQLMLASDLRLATKETMQPMLELAERVSKMLYRLQQSLVRSKNDGSRGPGTRDPGPDFGGCFMSVTHFRDLDVWRVAMELARHVYEVAATFPREERYGLTSQMQRAAVSIPSNIAEGNARQSTRDYARFIGIASGSVAELQTQLMLASDLRLATKETMQPMLELAERVSKMLYRLQQSLVRSKNDGSRVPGPGSRN